MVGSGSFHIAVIDDNPFYNRLLCETLQMMMKSGNESTTAPISFHPYASPDTFLMAGRNQFDLIFLDYFFDNSRNASEVIDPIHKKCDPVKIYLLSEVLLPPQSNTTLLNGIAGFLIKDEETFRKCHTILLETLT